jgi:hypothetical protein
MFDAVGLDPPAPIDGRSFYRTAFEGAPAARDHVTIGWHTAMTVIDDHWWFNSLIDGRGAFLYDSPTPHPDAPNVADAHPEVARRMYELGKADAKGGFPDWLLHWASFWAPASGCSPFAALGHEEQPSRGAPAKAPG